MGKKLPDELKKMEQNELELLKKIKTAQLAELKGRDGVEIKGCEVNNPVPVMPSVGLREARTVADQVNAVLASREADRSQETLEDAMDFDVLDPFDTHEFLGRYELMDDDEFMTQAELEAQQALLEGRDPDENVDPDVVGSEQPGESEGPDEGPSKV